MLKHNIALIGFGGVGQAFVEILHTKQTSLKRDYGWAANIVAITDWANGALYDPNGLDLEHVLRAVREAGSLDAYPDTQALRRGMDSMQTIRESNADLIVEVTYTDVKNPQPALDHCRCAFEHGKHVITSNKGPVALAYAELRQLAEKNDCFFGIEGTVMSGTPALGMPLLTLSGIDIRSIRGILNGTCNVILSKMKTGIAFNDALKYAQVRGYAEADPTNDIDGYDARYKIVILANVLMGQSLKPNDVPCVGISRLRTEHMVQATREGKEWKLIARIDRQNGQVRASVRPEKVDAADPLAGISGPMNALAIHTDLLGTVTLSGPGAGRKETGFALLIDALNSHRRLR